MNRLAVILYLSIFLFISSCNPQKKYTPKGLKKLSESEMLERARNKTLIHKNTIIKDSLGNTLTRDSLDKMNPNDFFGDLYENENKEIVEVVLRKASPHDKELIKKIEEAFKVDLPIQVIDVDCDKMQTILEEVHFKEQTIRQGGTSPDLTVDAKNQQLVVSIIEKCGFPSAGKHGQISVEAAFLVIQHAGRNLREKYFPLLKESANKGDLKWSLVALMEDRMFDG